MFWKARLFCKDRSGKDATEEDMIDIEQELNKIMVMCVNEKFFTVRFHIIGKEQNNGNGDYLNS